MSPASGKKGHGTTQLCCSIVEGQLETNPSPSPRAAHLQQNPPVLLGHSALQVLFDSLWCIWHPSAQADAGQLPLRALQCRGLRGAGVPGMQLPASSELSINYPHDEPGTCTPSFSPLRSRETLP